MHVCCGNRTTLDPACPLPAVQRSAGAAGDRGRGVCPASPTLPPAAPYPPSRTRMTVCRLTSYFRAKLATPAPTSSSFRTASRFASDNAAGRPTCIPDALTRAISALVRSRRKSLSRANQVSSSPLLRHDRGDQCKLLIQH